MKALQNESLIHTCIRARDARVPGFPLCDASDDINLTFMALCGNSSFACPDRRAGREHVVVRIVPAPIERR